MEPNKQQRRADEARHSAGLMRQVLAGLRSRLDENLKAHQVTTAQVRVLSEIRKQPEASGADVARACQIAPQSAQAMLARAVARGWIVRGKNAKNGRLVTVRLTPTGEALLALADAETLKVELDVWADVGLKELKALNDLLQRGLKRL